MSIQQFFVLLLFSCIFWQKGWSQDAEFSQFYAAPSHLNPSMIGFSAEPKFVLNYRHQQPTFGNAYLSLAASYDQHFDKYNSSVGVSLLADRAGEGGMYNTYFVNGLYAYELQFNRKLFLKVGAQVSYFHQSLNWGALTFTDQIDPVSGLTTGATGEIAPQTLGIHRLDISMGAVAYTPQLYVGVAFKHINTPSLSFTNNDDPYNDLKIRSVAHAGYVLYLGPDYKDKPRFYVSPNVMLINQGRYWQFNVGSYVGKGIAFGGLWYRQTLGNAGALIAMAGVNIGVVRVAYSFDYNLAAINTISQAHEISLAFDFGQTYYASKRKKRKRAAQCPEIFRQ